MVRTQRQRTDGMTGDYPADWPAIAKRIKDAANWTCERCGHKHDVENHYVLIVHHLDMDKANCADWNLAALCQRCHLSIQGRVDFSQGYMLEHSPWMRPHVEAIYTPVQMEQEPPNGLVLMVKAAVGLLRWAVPLRPIHLKAGQGERC